MAPTPNRKKRNALATAAGIFASLLAGEASGNPVDTFGLGSRSTAMAGAVAADVDDFSANYYNPAGLVSAKSLRIDLGYVRGDAHLSMNGKDNHVDAVRALVFGLVAPGKVAGVPFAFGVGLHLPDDRVLRVRSLEQSQPRWEMYDNRTQRLFFAANLAVRPFSWLEIGGGLGFLAQTRARLDITGGVDLSDPKMSLLRHEVDADLTSIRYPQVGVRVIASDKLRFAAVYRGQFSLNLDIDARLAVTASYLAVQVPLLALITTRSVNAFQPQQLVVGGSYDLADTLTIDADLTWVNWSAYESPVTRVSSNVKIGAGLPPKFIPEPAAPTNVLPPNFHDTLVPRVGAEWRIPLGARGHQLALRGGYFYERSPIPEQSGGTNFVDGDRHAFSVGMGVKLAHPSEVLEGDLRFDIHAMLSLIPERTMHKQTAADIIGDYRAGGSIVLFGATLGVVF